MCCRIGNVTAWQPIELPAPYVKPRRFVVDHQAEAQYAVKDKQSQVLLNSVAFLIPTREAAQRIADIYEEVSR